LENIDSLVPEINEEKTFYGLPLKVKDLLKSLRGIGCLYEWQDELLKIMQEKDRKELLSGKINLDKYNLLYLSPTSGGKTLVAEILILQCLLLQKKNCIFIMPYVAIVQEKVELMLPFGEKLNFYVEEYAHTKGVIPPVKRQSSRNKPTLYICTMEKAHTLINSLIEYERLNEEVGMVVADELHMIGDGQRGAIYEIILSKIKFCSKIKYQKILNEKSKTLKKKIELPIRIVATTATLSNKQELALFLNAYLYERMFRPVELKEHIMVEKQIFEVDKEKLKNYAEDREFVDFRRKLDVSSYNKAMNTEDIDGLIALVKEVFDPSPEGNKESCLIFCSTKQNCESVAKLLAKYLPTELKAYKRDLKLMLFKEMKECNANNCCEVLSKNY
jgi:POLQ-like helicase